MKKFIIISLSVLLCAVPLFTVLSRPPSCWAWEDDYIISPRDAWEAESYNRRRGSLGSDYDHDGTPNLYDPYDNKQLKDPAQRDYDNDGIPNYYDPYDNDWYKP